MDALGNWSHGAYHISLKEEAAENRWLTIDCARSARKLGRFFDT